MISGYYCDKCQGGVSYLSYLKTGALLSTSDQSGYFQKHTVGRQASPRNGVFFNTGTAFYQTGGNQIGHSGIIEVEMSGGVNAYLNFSVPIAEMQRSGIAFGDSSLGKAVLINNPDFVHWYAVMDYGSFSGFCADCGKKLF